MNAADSMTGGVVAPPADARSPEPADEELLATWAAGSMPAGSELFERHFAVLHRFFSSKLTGLALIDDLIQQTFLACLERPPPTDSISQFRAYLLGVARRRLMRFFRSWYRERRALSAFGPSADEVMPSPSSVLRLRTEVQTVAVAMRKIPIDLQIALELYYQESLRVRDIAAVLEIPAGTVKSRLSRGRTELAKAVARLEADPHLLRSTQTRLESWTGFNAAERSIPGVA